MPETISQWSSEYLPGVLLSLTLWTLAAAAIGLFAGLVIYLFLRIIRIYRMKFQLGWLVSLILLFYTVTVCVITFALIGFFESLKRQADEVLATEDNRQMIGELSGALSSRGAALAYAYGMEALKNPEAEPSLPAVIAQVDEFNKDDWGIDLSQSDQAFDQITDEVIQQNYETVYQFIFKDVAGKEEDSRQQLKALLDRFVDPEKLKASLLVDPLRSTLADLERRRAVTGKSGLVFATELKTHSGERTSEFITTKLGAILLAQQIFIGIMGALFVGVPAFLALVIKILIKLSAKKPPPQANPSPAPTSS